MVQKIEPDGPKVFMGPHEVHALKCVAKYVSEPEKGP
jgi:hypothetical protein